jgi:predicted metal-binding protein
VCAARIRFGSWNLRERQRQAWGLLLATSSMEEQMKRRMLLGIVVAALGLAVAGDGWVYAARRTPLREGSCRACSNCKYCKHCSKDGGRCSVCK